MPGSSTQALQAPLELARTGVAAHNKRPCTAHGFYNASKDASEVRELWRRDLDDIDSVLMAVAGA